jgi:hypothetical protein
MFFSTHIVIILRDYSLSHIVRGSIVTVAGNRLVFSLRTNKDTTYPQPGYNTATLNPYTKHIGIDIIHNMITITIFGDQIYLMLGFRY